MNFWPYLSIIEFIPFALAGAWYHWLEKTRIHHSSKATLLEYITLEKEATYAAAKWMFGSLFALSMAHTGQWGIEVSEVIASIGIGYGFDNALNKAHDES